LWFRQWWLKQQWDSWDFISIAANVALVLLVVIWLLWWRLPVWQAARLRLWETKARADVEDNFRKTVGQALGGAAVLVGAAAAYLQFTQQQQASYDLLISNQVSKSFEQLGSQETATGLGGIYGLEGVMNTSAQYHEPVLEALCAFVRDSTTSQQGTFPALLAALFSTSGLNAKGKVDDQPATDVQAALTVIGRRKSGPGEVNLVGAKIPRVNLTDAYLEAANLGRTHLERAILDGAHLERSYLGEAHLEGAITIGAHLERANLIDAHLEGAYLGGLHLGDAVLLDAHLEGAFLIHAYLEGTLLTRAHLEGTNLTEADLSSARDLVQAQLDQACGKPKGLPPGLTLDKPCPPRPATPNPPP
jgi:hypothetical protein